MYRVAVLIAVCLLCTSCQSIERNAVKSSVHDAFESTMTRGTELTELGDGLYTYRWMSYRTIFLVTDQGVVVFDPLNRDAAAGLRRAIDDVAPDQSIRHVIYSHDHRDHISGADALGGDPTILAHEHAARGIDSRGYDDVSPPTETFSGDRHTLEIGGETIELIHLPGFHGDGMVVTHFPERDTLYAVDLVWPNQLPPPAAPLSFSGSQRALDRVLSLDFEIFVPGHAAVSERRAVRNYAGFLDDLEAEFRSALERHDISDFHARQTFSDAPDEIGEVFYEVIDALEPEYGDWENYDVAMLNTVQWCMWSVITGE